MKIKNNSKNFYSIGWAGGPDKLKDKKYYQPNKKKSDS